MNLSQLQTKLLHVARNNPANDHVPYAFEKRIMARLSQPVADAWSVWGRALWRAALAYVVAVALFGGWAFEKGGAEEAELSQAFENTVMAAVGDPLTEDVW